MCRHDLPEVVAIESETLSPWSESALFADLERGENTSLYVVLQSLGKTTGRIVGWYSVLTCFPEAELLKIAVKKRMQGRGIGCETLCHLTAGLASKNFQTLFLEVRSRNQTALKLYKKNGFVMVGCRVGYYIDPPDDAVLLRKNLQH